MSDLVTTKPQITVHEAAPLSVSLKAAVKRYILDELKLETHSSYEPRQELARANNGRPSAVSALSALVTFTASGISSDVTDEAEEEADLPL
jgi:hypothetical protein